MIWSIFVLSLQLHPKVFTRRLAITSAISSSVPVKRAVADDDIDWLAHWSFFGLASPPIEYTTNYTEFLKLAKHDEISTIQIAVQHDCLIGTTKNGHRIALLIPDQDVPRLILDASKKNRMPFKVLPINENLQNVRNVWIFAVWSYIVFSISDLFGIVPWDTTYYGSIAERKEIFKNGKQKKSLKERLFDNESVIPNQNYTQNTSKL